MDHDKSDSNQDLYNIKVVCIMLVLFAILFAIWVILLLTLPSQCLSDDFNGCVKVYPIECTLDIKKTQIHSSYQILIFYRDNENKLIGMCDKTQLFTDESASCEDIFPNHIQSGPKRLLIEKCGSTDAFSECTDNTRIVAPIVSNTTFDYCSIEA